MNTIGLLLIKLGRSFDNWNVDEARMSKNNYVSVLLDEGIPQYESMRTVNEKLRILQALRICKLLNKTTIAFDVAAVKAYLASQRE